MYAAKKCVLHGKDIKNKVIVTVKESHGDCTLHKVGERFEITYPPTPENRSIDICPLALNAFYYKIYGMLFGGQFPWQEENPDSFVANCPDFDNMVVFELKRVKLDK